MTIKTFGYRYNDAPSADVTFDARCLTDDPASFAPLAHLKGTDAAVVDFFRTKTDVQSFATCVRLAVASGFVKTIAVGCHSGRHRSVYIAHRAAEDMSTICGLDVDVIDLDVDRPLPTADAEDREVC